MTIASQLALAVTLVLLAWNLGRYLLRREVLSQSEQIDMLSLQIAVMAREREDISYQLVMVREWLDLAGAESRIPRKHIIAVMGGCRKIRIRE